MRVLDNVALKLVSVALAALLWFVIAGQESSERGLTVPVELQNVPKDLELLGEPTNVVDVRMRASPGVIQRLGPGDVSAQVDLTGISEGEHIIHLTEDAIRVPRGVRVVKISPSLLTMHFERTMTKTVPVRARLLGRPAPAYEVAEVLCEPPDAARKAADGGCTVQVAGPRSRVQELESAFTEPVSVEGATETVVAHVNIGLEDPVLRIQGNPRVTVTVKIRELHGTRTLANLEVEPRGGEASLRPARVSVVLAGPVSALRAVAAEQVRPWVDAARHASGPAPVSVELVPGKAGVTVKEVVPERVTVRSAARQRN